MTLTASTYGTSNPFSISGSAPSVTFQGSSIVGTDVTSRLQLFKAPTLPSLYAMNGAATSFSNVAFSGSGIQMGTHTYRNVTITTGSITPQTSIIFTSTLTTTGLFDGQDGGSATDSTISASTLNARVSTYTRCSFTGNQGTWTDVVLVGASEKSNFTSNGSASQSFKLYGTTISDYYIYSANSHIWLATASSTFTNCEFDVREFRLPDVVASGGAAASSYTLNSGNKLRTQILTLTSPVSFTFNVANLEVRAEISHMTGVIGTVRAITSATTAKWVLSSSVTIKVNIVVDMNGLNELEYFVRNSAGITVPFMNNRPNRILLNPTTLKIIWDFPVMPTAASRMWLFSSSVTYEWPRTTTIPALVYGGITYELFLEGDDTSSYIPAGIRLIRYGLPPRPVYFSAGAGSPPYTYDGSGCLTTSTLCSVDLPCRSNYTEGVVTSLPDTNAVCELYFVPSLNNDGPLLTFELPEAQSNNKVRLIATGGLSTARFTFRPKSGVTTPASVELIGNPYSPSASNGFDLTWRYISFEGMPSSFEAYFNLKLRNPRIIASAGTLTFGPNSVVNMVSTAYFAAFPIQSHDPSSHFVFQGGHWSANETTSAAPPLRLINGTSASVSTSQAGLVMTNLHIASANVTLASATLTKTILDATAVLDLSQSTVNVSSLNTPKLVAKSTDLLNCDLSISVPNGQAATSNVDETCEVFKVNTFTLDGEAYVTIGSSQVQIANASVASTSQLNLRNSAAIESIKVTGGVLALAGDVTNITKMDFRGGKLLGDYSPTSSKRQADQNLRLLSVSQTAVASKWTIDSNVQMSLQNLTIDMADLVELEYLAETEEGVQVETSSPSPSTAHILVRPTRVRIQWRMNNAPVQGKDYTVFSGHGWLEDTFPQIVANFSNNVNLTVDSSNGRVVWYTGTLTPIPVTPPVNVPVDAPVRAPVQSSTNAPTKKKSTPYWAWIILVLGLLLLLALIIALVVVFLLKKRKNK